MPIERTDTFGTLGRLSRLRSSLKAHGIEGYVESISEAIEKSNEKAKALNASKKARILAATSKLKGREPI